MQDWAREALNAGGQPMIPVSERGAGRLEQETLSLSVGGAGSHSRGSSQFIVMDDVKSEGSECSGRRPDHESVLKEGMQRGEGAFNCSERRESSKTFSSSPGGHGFGDLIGVLQDIAVSVIRSHNERSENLFADNPADYHWFMQHFDTYV